MMHGARQAGYPPDDAQLSRKTLDEGLPNNFEDKATTTGPSPLPLGSRLTRAVSVGKKKIRRVNKSQLSSRLPQVLSRRSKGTVVSPLTRLRLLSTPTDL